MNHNKGATQSLRFLLIGPYDPHCGEYTFLAPPPGVWRLVGTLRASGIDAVVFDPNCCGPDVEAAVDAIASSAPWDLIGISTTGMTLPYDLALTHRVRRLQPDALLVAGGMEATFQSERTLKLGPPFDLAILGEGEKPLLEIAHRLRQAGPGVDLTGIAGTAMLTQAGQLVRFHQRALDRHDLHTAIAATPYDCMPYKAEREARLSEIRSVRLINGGPSGAMCGLSAPSGLSHAATDRPKRRRVGVPRVRPGLVGAIRRPPVGALGGPARLS